MKTFKQFLTEGGHATEKYNTERAKPADVKAALEFVSKALNIQYDTLKNDLLGSTELTLLGKKADSGDIDIAFSLKDTDALEIDKKMKDATNGEGNYNAGTKVGSYAVPVNGKKVQVDLMFVNNKDWAKFSYYSAIGRGSKYPGAVRNIILFTALSHTQEPGKDFVIRGEDGKPIVRASKSITMDAGMKRLFKMAKVNAKTGKYNKSLETVTGDDIEKHLKEIGKDIKFSKDIEFTDKPDDVAKHIFGPNVKAQDLMTAENVITQIKKLKNANEILAAAKAELTKLKMEVPSEL
jgi:hypothetical protein